MDHRSHTSSGYNQPSAHKRGGDDNWGRNHSDKRFKPTHHQSGSARVQNPPTSQALSTRRELYEKDFPVYKQPVEVGCFSLDSERRFFSDSRQMRYYVEPDRNPNFDLRDGHKDRFTKRDDSVKEKLDHMLRWIVVNRSKLNSRPTTSSSWWVAGFYP